MFYTYAGNTTFYACESDLHNLISRLKHDSVLPIEFFECNYMKLNQDKYHLLTSGHKYESVWANIGSCKIWESNDQKLLETNIDCNSKFNFKTVHRSWQNTKSTNQNLQIHES